MKIRDRIVELVRVKPEDLVECPWNWRVHSKNQQEVLRGLLGEVGIANAVLTRRLKNGKLMLIDGHLRKKEFAGRPEQKVPTLVLDVSEKEAKKLLASLDPLAGMAETDAKALRKLLREVETGSKELAGLFTNLAKTKRLSIRMS